MMRHPLLQRAFIIALAKLAVLLAIGLAHGIECNMSQAFMQPDGNAKGGTTSVWSNQDASALFFIESLNVNTDGARRSYSVEDFWGERKALNNLCNAMSDKCAGLSTEEELRNRRILTQKAYADGWPADQLQRTKIASSIIPFKDGKPCPLVDDYLVSATALHKPKIDDVCDISSYVDALVVPALVLPGNPSKTQLSEFAKRKATVGDLVVAMVPNSTQPVYAVVGDIGPPGELGEGSVALTGTLLEKTASPVNYREIRGRGEFKGRGWTVPRAIVLIFPGTHNKANPYMTMERIEEDAKKRFDEWGGIDKLASCAAQYTQ